MTKPLMKYVPQKYYSSIRDFYKDSEGYWLCLKADGDYIIEYGNNVSNITVRNLTAFATFEEAEEKSKTNRYGIKKE